MADDGFQFVSRKRAAKKRNRPLNAQKNLQLSTLQFDNFNIENYEKLAHLIKEGLSSFIDTDFWKTVQDEAKSLSSTCGDVHEFVCYGLGLFASCVIARQQLFLALALRNALHISKENCFIFDPLYSASYQEFLSDHLNFTPLQSNEEGKRKVEKRTLFFMPHCGKALYNNLLWKNWKPEQLSQVIIVGNSFNYMNDSTPKRILEKEANYILHTLDFCLEKPLPTTYPQMDVFNNTSLLTFDRSKLKKCPEAFWMNCNEPQYEESDTAEVKFNAK